MPVIVPAFWSASSDWYQPMIYTPTTNGWITLGTATSITLGTTTSTHVTGTGAGMQACNDALINWSQARTTTTGGYLTYSEVAHSDWLHPRELSRLELYGEVAPLGDRGSRNLSRLDPGEEEQAAREQETRWHERDAQRQIEADQARARNRVEAERRATAATRAKELLLAHLDAQQKRDVLEHDYFEVISNRGRRWRIRMSSHVGNVDLMPIEGEIREASFCAHSPGDLPTYDHFLAQKLVLESDEGAFLHVANTHFDRRPVRGRQIVA